MPRDFQKCLAQVYFRNQVSIFSKWISIIEAIRPDMAVNPSFSVVSKKVHHFGISFTTRTEHFTQVHEGDMLICVQPATPLQVAIGNE